ncbi:YqgE/AlgH family protein [Kamptonema cortianum]|nr:YqgE/AlgH family protein [Oscillatoria laete-virens]MDK3160257.1 YqgE/AlgH family protein [Kamptonema cortianum]MDL5048391.1 YqgE/AlgH family protein [Oscillatoria amoena NRMC-F 0135]MDL5054244.1 YqgE/AlgH family protein [Oscillatoria laete-virens NRMC-F 0139]
MPTPFQSLKGKFLLDNGSLDGTFFGRTVVLICEHNTKGAFGLVLNKSVDTTIGSALAAELTEEMKNSPLYVGGPVQTNSLSFLYEAEEEPFGQHIIDRVCLGHSLDELQELAQDSGPGLKVKIFAGYSGWSSGQLEDEIQRDSWLILEAHSREVFDRDPASLWRRILTQLGWQYKLIADFPEEPGWN